MFESCSCSAILDFVCEETLDSKRIGESMIVGVEVEGFYNGEAMEGDAQALDRTVRWKVCDTKDSCGMVFSALRGLGLRCRVVERGR